MSTMILVFIGIAVALFFMNQKDSDTNSSSESSESNNDKNKYKAKALMTPNEIEFFNRLIQGLPEYYVFPQVSLGTLLEGDAQEYKERNRIRLTFAQKIADYVIYTKEMKPVAIIELDDKTHNQEKDEKRDAMLAQAGYKIIRFNSKRKPSVEELKNVVN